MLSYGSGLGLLVGREGEGAGEIEREKKSPYWAVSGVPARL